MSLAKPNSSLEILNQTKGKLPRLPFATMKDKILDARYELSVSFVTRATSRSLNRQHRGKDHPTNILSFELSSKSGELVICPDIVKAGASEFDMDYKNFLGFLLIHGMLHLKGMAHGSTMERQETRFKKMFKIIEQL